MNSPWVMGLACVLLAGCSPTPPPAAVGTTNQVAPVVASSATSRQKLVGNWARTDGNYVIAVHSVEEATGKLVAEYRNPGPIHVAQAQAEQKDGKLTVFVELQDANYPGCTYRLTYLPQTDQLYGVYYQAAIQQSFDVEFERVK